MGAPQEPARGGNRDRQPSGPGLSGVPGLRAVAEGKLARARGGAQGLTGKTGENALYELHVHQIELEMQNEELRRTQVALEESRDRYLDLYDFAPVGYFTLTPKGRIAKVNLAGAAILGLGCPKLVRRGLGRFVAPKDRDRWDQHLVSVLQSSEKQACELTLRREDGSTFDAHLDSIRLDRPAREAGDGDTGPVIRVAMSDISDLKRAEESLGQAKGHLEIRVKERTAELEQSNRDLQAEIAERKRAEGLLRESEERFRTLVEAITDYTYRVAVHEGRVVQTTHGPGCLGVTGYSPEEFHADPELWFRMVHLEDQPSVFDWAARLSAGLKAGPLEHRIIHRDGGTRWVRNSAVARHNSRGQYLGYEGLIQDFTSYQRLLDQFAQAQKMEAIGQLAGGVAHDFRNQLTVIKGYGEMLLRRDLVKDAGKEPLGHVLRAADRSATISAQLLAFSRQQVLRPEVVNIVSATGDMMKSVAQTLGEDIRLSVMPCGDLWCIRVDIGQFQQALLNLVLNARDAMPQGGKLTVETDNIVLDEGFVRQHVGASAGRYVVLTVTDTGCGMDAGTLGRLFEPFFTTKPVGEGTGLGLAMVHGFVAQSGGFIAVQSQLGQPAGHGTPAVPGGTTFRLYFPAIQDVADSAERPSQTTGLPGGSGTILVVEDEEAIRRILSETLRECGYTVLTAGNAQEAMALAESARQKVNLLITDVVMPGWSGPELAKHFQATRPGIPVLMISGHTGNMLTGHGVIPSDVDLLSKPFSSRTLAETVRKVLRQPNRP